MLCLEDIEEKFGDHSPMVIKQLVAEVRELRQKCADLASGDPAVRLILLREFGTTDPVLLSDMAKDRHEHIRELMTKNAKMLAVLDKLWADKDAPQEDQAAARRLYNAWLDLRDVRNEMHDSDKSSRQAFHSCQPQPVTFVSEGCSEELRKAFASLPPGSGQIQVLPPGATYERAEFVYQVFCKTSPLGLFWTKEAADAYVKERSAEPYGSLDMYDVRQTRVSQ